MIEGRNHMSERLRQVAAESLYATHKAGPQRRTQAASACSPSSVAATACTTEAMRTACWIASFETPACFSAWSCASMQAPQPLIADTRQGPQLEIALVDAGLGDD